MNKYYVAVNKNNYIKDIPKAFNFKTIIRFNIQHVLQPKET